MATNSDHSRIGNSASLTSPDPKLNAGQILAWAICWPWNLLWTVCAYNPLFWLIDVAVREFRSALEEISTGQFREIERELTDDLAVARPAMPLRTADPAQAALVVGDPLPGWPSESAAGCAPAARQPPVVRPAVVELPGGSLNLAANGHAVEAGTPTGTLPPSAETSTCGEASAIGTAKTDVELRGSSERSPSDGDSWTWTPPAASRSGRISQPAANWYSVGELKDAPEVSTTPLKSASRQQSPSTSSGTPVPPSVLDAWKNLPAAPDDSVPPLN